MLISVFAGADIGTVRDVVERTRRAAQDGFRTIWFPQTPRLDTLTALAVAAAEVPAIGLGTAVVPIQGRHPLPLAQQALTVVDAAGPGRFCLGVGVTHPTLSEQWFGVPYATVVQLCAEELEALAGLLSPERTAHVDGRFVTVHATLDSAAAPPGLMLAALGPKMLALAGRFAEGTVTWMTGPGTLARTVVPTINASAAAAGRPLPRVVVGLPVCVTDDVDGARDRLREVMAAPSSLPSYRRMLAAEGVDEPVDIALIGDEDEVRRRLVDLEAAGATELLANVQGTAEEAARTRAFLGALAAT